MCNACRTYVRFFEYYARILVVYNAWRYDPMNPIDIGHIGSLRVQSLICPFNC